MGYAWGRFLTWMGEARPRVPDLVPVGLLCVVVHPDGDDVAQDPTGARILWPEDFPPEDRVTFLESIARAYRQGKRP